jgi:hypothetical protein
MQPITLEKRIKQGNKRNHAFMEVKNVNGIVSQMRFKLVGIDHSIPDKNKITDVDHSKYLFAIGSHEPFTFAHQLMSSEKFSSHYVPQMLAFVKHCHSRMIVLGDFAMHNIAVNSSGTCRYIDMSNSRLHNGGPVQYKGILNAYHAPETHLCGKIFTSSDVYSFALWWISGMERQPVDTWGSTDPYKIWSIAMEKATSPLQKEMLNIDPALRPSMAKVVDQYAADSHGLAANVSYLSQSQRLLQSIFHQDPTAFAKILECPDLGDVVCVLPSILNFFCAKCPPHSTPGFDIYKLAAANFLDALFKLHESDAEFLINVMPEDLFGVANMMGAFMKVESAKALVVLSAFVKAKLFEVDEAFFADVLDCCQAPADVELLASLAPTCLATRVAVKFARFAKDAEGDVAEVQRLQGQLDEKSLELANAKTTMFASQQLYNDLVDRVQASKRKLDEHAALLDQALENHKRVDLGD